MKKIVIIILSLALIVLVIFGIIKIKGKNVQSNTNNIQMDTSEEIKQLSFTQAGMIIFDGLQKAGFSTQNAADLIVRLIAEFATYEQLKEAFAKDNKTSTDTPVT